MLATVVGLIGFGPFPTWNSLVNAVTGATAVMYAMGPVALAALKKHDPDRKRTYVIPLPGVVLPAAFCSANLILYFGGFDTMWKIDAAIGVGMILFAIGGLHAGTFDLKRVIKPSIWVPGWLAGMFVIALLGRYGDSQLNVLPEWIDLLVVIAYSVAIYYWAVSLALPRDRVQKQLVTDAEALGITPLAAS